MGRAVHRSRFLKGTTVNVHKVTIYTDPETGKLRWRFVRKDGSILAESTKVYDTREELMEDMQIVVGLWFAFDEHMPDRVKQVSLHRSEPVGLELPQPQVTPAEPEESGEVIGDPDTEAEQP
jgi:hypothetical protein